MEFSFIKSEARKMRYKERARKARIWSRFTGFLLICTLGVAVWQDDTFGPDLQNRILAMVSDFEDATENSSNGNFVSVALAKLNL